MRYLLRLRGRVRALHRADHVERHDGDADRLVHVRRQVRREAGQVVVDAADNLVGER